MMKLISYCDGDHCLLEIAELSQKPFCELRSIVDKVIDKGLVVC